jgi:hypothetical protein
MRRPIGRVAILLGIVTMGTAVLLPVAISAGPGVATQGQTIAVKAPPERAAKLAAQARGPAVSRPQAAPHQGSPVRLIYETFESGTFPPAGWQLTDPRNPIPTDFAWSAETCDVDPLRGGDVAAWAVGGGPAGSQLSCAAPYTEPVDSWLSYGPIDATGLAGGLRATMLVRLDQPGTDGGNLQVCATGPLAGNFTCIPVGPAQLNWGTFPRPLSLHWSAGLPEVYFALRYADGSPAGGDFGAFVDNILVEGIPGAGTPTPTGQAPTVAPSASPTRTPTRPVIQGPTIYLPLLLKDTDMADLPRPSDAGASVAFGVDVDDQGNLIQPGSVFQYGVPTICARIGWFGQPPGSSVRWQWLRNGSPLTGGINGERSGVAPTGYQVSCGSGGEDAQGNPLPVPKGTYEVQMFMNGAPSPTASGQVVIQDDPPPGATPIPTGPAATLTPTGEPTPGSTVVPTPEPDGCSEYLQNTGFESGPESWYAFLNQAPLNPSTLIMRAADTAFNPPKPPAAAGEWLAQFGATTNVEQQLGQSWAGGGALIDPTRMVSSTLRFSFMIVTQETANVTHDDTLAPYFVRADGTAVQAPESGLSEEVLGAQIRPGVWYDLTSTVTEQMTQRLGWDRASLNFVSRHNGQNLTAFLVDEVHLTVCTRPAATAPAQSGGRTEGRRLVRDAGPWQPLRGARPLPAAGTR